MISCVGPLVYVIMEDLAFIYPKHLSLLKNISTMGYLKHAILGSYNDHKSLISKTLVILANLVLNHDFRNTI